MCDSKDLTLHTMLSELVATVRQDPWQGGLSVIAWFRQLRAFVNYVRQVLSLEFRIAWR